MKKNYFAFNYKENGTAGAKAKEDANEIFKMNGFNPIKIMGKEISQNKYLNTLVTLFSGYKKIGKLKHLVLAENFPPSQIGESHVIYKINSSKERKKNLNILLIHDLEELRNPDYSSNKGIIDKAASVNVLIDADCVISHNAKMTQWLVEKGVDFKKIVDLQLFDYLSLNPSGEGGEFGKQVIIAGNLSTAKSGYLYQLSKIHDIELELYGPGLSEDIVGVESVHYHGSYPSSQILEKISGSYGLVWDGESVEGGVGISARYQMYNNPHKVSLYLAAGFPVIMWREAALAPFILENNLGFVVDNLLELSEKISNISEQDYAIMKENVQKMGEKIRSGYFLTEALKKAEKIIEEQDK